MCKSTGESSACSGPDVEKLRALVKEQVMADINGKRSEYLYKPPGFLDKILLGALEEQRDAPLLYLVFNLCTTILPTAIIQFALPTPSIALGIFHLFMIYVLYAQRFILTLHFSEHRRLFSQKSGLGFLRHLLPYVIAPLFGIPSGMYKLHHVVMHHLENNVHPHDVSSTEPYQRNNFLHFCFYWARYTFAVWLELPYYAFKRARWSLLAHSFVVAAIYLGGVSFLYGVNPTATKMVFIYPYFITSFALMFGNWSQHIFVNPSDPRNSYSLTYNCVNTPDNQKSYNDGYHIIHHVNARCHWSEMPQRFLDTMDKHAEADALTFRGLGFFEIGVLCMLRRWGMGVLADRMMDIRGPARSREEKIALLYERLQPIGPHTKAE